MAQRSSVAQTALPYAPRYWALGRQSHAVLGLEAVPGEGGGATCLPCERGLLSILLAPLFYFPTLVSISKAGQQKAADAHSEPIKNIFLPYVGALLWHVASSQLAVFCGMPVPAAEQRGAGFLEGCPPANPCARTLDAAAAQASSAACGLPFCGWGNCRVMKCVGIWARSRAVERKNRKTTTANMARCQAADIQAALPPGVKAAPLQPSLIAACPESPHGAAHELLLSFSLMANKNKLYLLLIPLFFGEGVQTMKHTAPSSQADRAGHVRRDARLQRLGYWSEPEQLAPALVEIPLLKERGVMKSACPTHVGARQE